MTTTLMYETYFKCGPVVQITVLITCCHNNYYVIVLKDII